MKGRTKHLGIAHLVFLKNYYNHYLEETLFSFENNKFVVKGGVFFRQLKHTCLDTALQLNHGTTLIICDLIILRCIALFTTNNLFLSPAN